MPKSRVGPKARQPRTKPEAIGHPRRRAARLRAATPMFPVRDYEAVAGETSPTSTVSEERLRVLEVLPIRMVDLEVHVRSLRMVQMADDQEITVSDARRLLLELHGAGFLIWDPARQRHIRVARGRG